MATSGKVAYVANTNNIELTGLKDDLSGAFINDASVTVTVKDANGAEVTGGPSWPILMDYVAASNGDYVAMLTRTLNLLTGKNYTAYIDADGSTSDTERFGHWELIFKAERRKVS